MSGRWWHLVGILLTAAALSGCLGRLIADKGMSEEDKIECRHLSDPVKTRFGLVAFGRPDGLWEMVGTQADTGDFPRDDPWPRDEPPSLGCRTEVRGVFLTLYTVVELRRVLAAQEQAEIIGLLRERRRQLPNAKPTLVRFIEREVWVVHRDVRGRAFGAGRGEERVLRSVHVR
jgi:hypothetical protein